MPRITPTKRPVVHAAAAAAVIGLTAGVLAGCSSPDDRTPEAEPAASAAPVTASAPAVVEAGAPVTADQPLPEYTKAYELADGTSVAVVKDQPLPAPVLAEVQAQVQAAMSTALAAGSDESIWAQTHDASKQLSGRVGSATGKRVLIVYPAVGMLEGENVENNHRVWIPRDVPGGGSNTQQGAVDAANAYVASQADPDEWVVIVASE